MAASNAGMVTQMDAAFLELGIKPDDLGTFVDAMTEDQLFSLIRIVKTIGGHVTVNASGNLVVAPVPGDTSAN